MQGYFSIFCLNTLFLMATNGQEQENLKGQYFLAPDFGLMLGSINQIEVSPALGYYLTDRLSAAAGFNYEFYSQTRTYLNQPAIKTNIYGPRVFARYTVFQNLGDFLPVGIHTALFAHTEFVSNSLEKKYFVYPNYSEKGRFWYSTFLVGGGISQTASERLRVNVLVLWDTDPGDIPLYSNPIIRFGFQYFFGSMEQ